MSDFAVFLGQKVERYIALRRALGYAFNKQAGTLRAFVRHVERAELDAPATRALALDFVLSFGGAANSRALRHGVLRQLYEYLAISPNPASPKTRPASRDRRGLKRWGARGAYALSTSPQSREMMKIPRHLYKRIADVACYAT